MADPVTQGVAPTFLALVAVVGGVIVLCTFFFMLFISEMSKNKQKEQTTRELAAYVAEGSITAEDAERIQRGTRPWHELREIARAASQGCASKGQKAAV
ncbi:MAG: hypothetical protein RIB58_13005 [Phycisphaerales bacterium]|jgi:hypothetical protein